MMERELFAVLMAVVGAVPGARRGPAKSTFRHADVLAVMLWAALHDRPISWATKRCNWPSHDRTRPLPSNATVSRRSRDPVIHTLLARTIAALRTRGEGEDTLVIDGRGLAVASHSADPDADFGRAAGGVRKGYKLHQIGDLLGNIRHFRVEPLRVSEQVVACELVAEIDPGGARTLLADGMYDVNALYECAGRRGVQLIAERRYKNARGVGHQHHSVHRLRALEMLGVDPTLTGPRRVIESCFGTQGNRVGGLGPLPNWVRRLRRVRLWVAAKLAIDAAHRWRKARIREG